MKRFIAVYTRTKSLVRSHHHVAIIGSGPAGFYTAKYLLEQNHQINIDMFESLPCPYGLVRYGVAPDHPEVKSVTNTFDEVACQSGRMRYFGNVTVCDTEFGVNCLPLSSLEKYYSKVVLAYGASNERALQIPGEKLHGVVSSRSFVNWYNGHPLASDSHKGNFDLKKVNSVVIVGQGNVALDCARILTKDCNDLATTDISSIALQELRNSTVQNIYIVGRRGSVQSSFTIKELRELTKLQDVNVHIDPLDLLNGMTGSSEEELANNRPRKRILELMRTISDTSKALTPFDISSKRNIFIKFLVSPTAIESSLLNHHHIGGVSFVRNQLTGKPFEQRAVSTAEHYQLPCDLLISAIGYKCEPISVDLPFDKRSSTVPNVCGKVTNKKNVYVSGWLKRGATGIIGTNIADAKETVQTILQDLKSDSEINVLHDQDPFDILSKEFPTIFHNSVSWKQAQNILSYEKLLGSRSSPSSARAKLLTVNEMLECVNKQSE